MVWQPPTKVNSKTANHMEEESKSGRKVEYTKDTGKMDLKMVLVAKFSPLVAAMKANLKPDWEKVKESIHGPTGINTKARGFKIKSTAKENTPSQISLGTKAIGRMVFLFMGLVL